MNDKSQNMLKEARSNNQMCFGEDNNTLDSKTCTPLTEHKNSINVFQEPWSSNLSHFNPSYIPIPTSLKLIPLFLSHLHLDLQVPSSLQ